MLGLGCGSFPGYKCKQLRKLLTGECLMLIFKLMLSFCMFLGISLITVQKTDSSLLMQTLEPLRLPRSLTEKKPFGTISQSLLLKLVCNKPTEFIVHRTCFRPNGSFRKAYIDGDV